MKIASILILASIILGGCFVQRDSIQADLTSAELIKIDTVYRYNGMEQILTWRCSDKMEYVTTSPITESYRPGLKVFALVRK